jgi:hypothetical protein
LLLEELPAVRLLTEELPTVSALTEKQSSLSWRSEQLPAENFLKKELLLMAEEVRIAIEKVPDVTGDPRLGQTCGRRLD